MPLIDAGKRAPAFTLKDQSEQPHKLADCKGTPVVLFFYPKDMTSGCTQEACDFRDLMPKFKRGKGKAHIFGISPQDTRSKAKFADKESLNYPILADPESKICEKYGVWAEKSMYGRKYMGVMRTTYLIDAGGKVAQRWDKVKIPGHAEAVLEAVRTIGS